MANSTHSTASVAGAGLRTRSAVRSAPTGLAAAGARGSFTRSVPGASLDARAAGVASPAALAAAGSGTPTPESSPESPRQSPRAGGLLTFSHFLLTFWGQVGGPGRGPAAAALQCPGQSSGCQPNQAPRFGAYRKIATLYFDFSPGFPHEKRQFGHACDLL